MLFLGLISYIFRFTMAIRAPALEIQNNPTPGLSLHGIHTVLEPSCAV